MPPSHASHATLDGPDIQNVHEVEPRGDCPYSDEIDKVDNLCDAERHNIGTVHDP